jgi:hypothetical protein
VNVVAAIALLWLKIGPTCFFLLEPGQVEISLLKPPHGGFGSLMGGYKCTPPSSSLPSFPCHCHSLPSFHPTTADVLPLSPPHFRIKPPLAFNIKCEGGRGER